MWPTSRLLIKSAGSFTNLCSTKTCKILFYNKIQKFSDNSRPVRILGIETSCDDTGIAIVDSNGTILGEALHSQYATHLRYIYLFILLYTTME